MLSVIIPVGPGRDASAAFASLAEAGLTDDDEVIVVGDGHAVDIPSSLSLLNLRSASTEVPMGANAARNRGARMAQRPILCFLDDDDAYAPGAVSRVKSIVDGAGPAMGAWSLTWRFASGRRQWTVRRPPSLHERHIRKRNIAGGCSSLVVRKAVFEQVGGFDETLPSMQDWDLWIRLSRVTPIGVVAPPLVLYNDHPGPRISTNRTARIAGLERLLTKHGPHWPASVQAFHRSRLAAERFRAERGRRIDILQPAAPIASLFFLARTLFR